jgi:hypothetical protein
LRVSDSPVSLVTVMRHTGLDLRLIGNFFIIKL